MSGSEPTATTARRITTRYTMLRSGTPPGLSRNRSMLYTRRSRSKTRR